MRVRVAGALGFLLVGGMALAQGPLPLGSEFQVNTSTTNSQGRPAVSSRANGEFVVSWRDDYTYPSDMYLRAQSFTRDGNPLGSEQFVTSVPCNYDWNCFSINQTSMFAQETGEFVVVWDRQDRYSGRLAGPDIVRGKRLDSTGSILAEFSVSSPSPPQYTRSHLRPAIAGNSLGDFVVAWVSCPDWYRWCYADYEIRARGFGADAQAVGDDFPVSTSTGAKGHSSVAMAADKRFVVVWQSSSADGSSSGLLGRRFGSDGLPAGGEFPINDNTLGAQTFPSVSMIDSGDFLVVWQSDSSTGDDDSGTSIQARWFDEYGSPQGPDFQVNSLSSSDQTHPTVVLGTDGRATVAWQHATADLSGHTDIVGRRIDWLGAPIDTDFRINTMETGDQARPSVAMLSEHEFVVVWEGPGDGDGKGIFGQRFDGSFLSGDGFESGDTSAWSSTVQ